MAVPLILRIALVVAMLLIAAGVRPAMATPSPDAERRSDSEPQRKNETATDIGHETLELFKWIVVAIGAVVSFVVIDYGKLKLERFRAHAENERELLNAYLTATEAPAPELWKRKLTLILNSSTDPRTLEWAQRELEYINTFAARDALYRETLRVASQLVEPGQLNEPARREARIRFNQLYWAELPFAGESEEVEKAMVAFLNHLTCAEKAGPEASDRWNEVNGSLIGLSKQLRDATEALQPAPRLRAP